VVRALGRASAVLALGSIVAAQTAPPPNTTDDRAIERPFMAGGHVRLQLASGDYIVRAGTSDRVLVRWMPGNEARTKDLQELSVAVQVMGSTATVITAGPARHVNFVIEIPERSDLHVRMRAGDIRLQDIEGHKDVRMTAGDLVVAETP
jgi:hypothetical protein